MPSQGPQDQSGPGSVLTKSSVARKRTSHACDRCRVLRTKCSGGTRCSMCAKHNTACAYGDRKRERNQKDSHRVVSLEMENKRLLDMLNSMTANRSLQQSGSLETLHDPLKAQRQRPKLQSERDSCPQIRTSSSFCQPFRSIAMSDSDPNHTIKEPNALSCVGSLSIRGELSSVVNLAMGGGASGFVGQMSEVAWIDHAYRAVRGSLDSTRPKLPIAGVLDPNAFSASSFIYYMDDDEVLAVDENHIDEYQTPPFSTSLVLSEAYFHAVQGAFPFIARKQFLRNLYTIPINNSWTMRRWLAKANIVWAIGAKWLETTSLNDTASPESHQYYYARARALGLDHRPVFDHPDIDQVQGMGLLALYLLFNGSVTRAWNTLGCAMRHATALGLHLKVTDPSISDEDKVRRARTWYSLYSLEVLISEITGRPKSISTGNVTVPLELLGLNLEDSPQSSSQGGNDIGLEVSRKIWLDYLSLIRTTSPETTTGDLWQEFAPDNAASRSYLQQRLCLSLLSDKIASRLYSGASDDSWSGLHRKIADLKADLERWVDNLSEDLAIEGHVSVRANPRVRTELAMYYHSLQRILHRPCLCGTSTEAESIVSQEFSRRSARACVHGAMSMLALLPKDPTTKEVYRLLPWWSLLHFVAQASAVLQLELALYAQHFEGEVHLLVESVRRAMQYLHCMAGGSLSAYRAWRIFTDLVTEVSSRYDDIGLTHLLGNAPGPLRRAEEADDVVIGQSIY